MSDLNRREQSLVSLGAALASNCLPCIEYHVPAARRTGLSDSEISLAIRIADKVRQVPARAALEAAEARIGDALTNAAETFGSSCGCGGSSAATKAGGLS